MALLILCSILFGSDSSAKAVYLPYSPPYCFYVSRFLPVGYTSSSPYADDLLWRNLGGVPSPGEVAVGRILRRLHERGITAEQIHQFLQRWYDKYREVLAAQARWSPPNEKRLAKGTLPDGWLLDEIAKGALPGGCSGSTYVLAWKQMGDDPSNLTDCCLVLTYLPNYDGLQRWDLQSMIHQEDGWRVRQMHITGYKGLWSGRWNHFYQCFDMRPTNEDVYTFADEPLQWFTDEIGGKRFDAKVCKDTWEAVLGEKPTRDFPKK